MLFPPSVRIVPDAGFVKAGSSSSASAVDNILSPGTPLNCPCSNFFCNTAFPGGYVIETEQGSVRCRVLCNCAGLQAAQVQAMLFPPSQHISESPTPDCVNLQHSHYKLHSQMQQFQTAMDLQCLYWAHTRCQELEVPFKRCGSLMVSGGPKGNAVLQKKLEQGQLNGVPSTSNASPLCLYHIATSIFLNRQHPIV